MTWSPGDPPSASPFVAREALTYVGLTLEDACGLTYGTNPCEAVAEGVSFIAAYSAVFNGSLQSWTVSGYTTTVSSDGVLLEATNTDPTFNSPSGLGINGSQNTIVLVDVERVVEGSNFQGTMYYSTSGGGGHGNSESYRKKSGFTNLVVGERRVYEFDMSNLNSGGDVGGTDWATSTIDRIRLDFDNGAGTGDFRVRSVKIGRYATAGESTGTDRCFNTRATCQDLTNFDLQDHPAGVGSYVSAVESTPASTTVTQSARAIGAVPAAGQTRKIVIGISAYWSSSAGTISSATLGGLAYTEIFQTTTGRLRTAIMVFPDPDDEATTADLVVAFSTQPAEFASVAWRTIDAGTVGDSATSTADYTANLGIDVTEDGSIFAMVAAYLQTAATTWSNATENVDDSHTNMNYSAALNNAAAAATAVGVSATQAVLARTAPTLANTFAGPRGDSGPAIAFTGLTNGDLLYACVVSNNGDPVGTTPTGWTLIDSVDGGAGGARLHLYCRTNAWSSGTTHDVEFAGFNNDTYSVGFVVRGSQETSGASGIRQIAESSGSTTTSPSSPAVTTDIQNSLIVDIIGRTTDLAGADFSAQTNANLTGYAENFDNGTSEDDGSGIMVASGVKAAVGDTGTSTATLGTTSPYASFKLAFHPTDNNDAQMAGVAIALPWTRPVRSTTKELLFAKSTEYRPLGIRAIPNIESVEYSPAKLDPGEGLGSRATLRVKFKDHPHTDAGPGLDPYYDQRSYDPYTQGTFWPRFRARQPYLRNEPLTWYQGFLGQELSEMEARHFVVESFDGPTIDGFFTIIAHDPLKMLDGDRAQCPAASEGSLQASLTNVATTFTISPSDVAEDYPASGYVAIGGREIVSFTRSGTTFTITRAQMNTTAIAHEAQDRVQLVKQFDGEDPADILYDLMVNFASVDPDWIPLTEWQEETAAYLRRNFSSDIAEPTPVSRLVAEIMQQGGLSLWWDDSSQKIRLRVLRPISTDADMFDESKFVRGSITSREQSDKRYSEIWISYGQINPLKSVEDRDNYRNHLVTSNLTARENYGTPKIKKIYSRWIAEGGSTAAERIANLQLSRYADAPRLFSFSLVRGAQDDPVLGEGYLLSHRVLQAANGSRINLPTQLIQMRPDPAEFAMVVEEFNFETESEEDLANRVITINASTYDIDGREWHDDLYVAPRTGDNITFRIASGVVVGSTSTAIPAFSVGTWPTQAMTGNTTNGSAVVTNLNIDAVALLETGLRISGTGIPSGATILSIDSTSQITLSANATATATGVSLTVALVNITIENEGTIIGAGGAGGQGANADGDDDGLDGSPGGTGLYTRYMISLSDTGAKTQGGGGGGGGGGCNNYGNDHKGGGGGGGAGSVAGAGAVGPGNGEDGLAGSLTSGGQGGRSYTSFSIFSGPELKDGVKGGNGGAPGNSGGPGSDRDLDGGNGGAGGYSIDGVSYVKTVGAAGTRSGSQVN